MVKRKVVAYVIKQYLNDQVTIIVLFYIDSNQMDDDIERFLAQNAKKYRSEKFILKVVLNICLSAAASGYMLAYFNTISFDDTVQIFAITQDRAFMQGLLSFCVPAGAAIGGLLFSYMVQRYSRKQCNLIVAYSAIASTLLLLSGNVVVIIICRLIQGITVGVGFVLRSMYIKQFSPIQLAGKMGSISQVMFSAGLIYTFVQTYLLSLIVSPQSYWPIVYAFPIVLYAIQIFNIHVYYPFETIKYLLEQRRKQEAQQLARRIYYDDYAKERIDQLQKFIGISQLNPEHQLQLSSEGTDCPHQKPRRGSKNNKYAVWTAHHLLILQQLTGIQIIIIYAGEIIMKIYPTIEKTLPILLNTLGLYASYQTIKLIQSHGRKEIIQKGTAALATLSLIFFACFFWKGQAETEPGDLALVPSLIIVLGFVAFRMIFSMTLGPVCWIYLAEIVEPNIIGISTMLNWLTAALISLAFPIMVDLLGGPEWMFCFLGLLMWVSYFINQHLMMETRGKTEWQIRSLYDQLLAADK